MTVLDNDTGADMVPAAGGIGVPGSKGALAPRDWQALYERERNRSRHLERRLDGYRKRSGEPKPAVQKPTVRKIADGDQDKSGKNEYRKDKEIRFLRSEVKRLEKLLVQAGIGKELRSTIVAQRLEVIRLRGVVRDYDQGQPAVVARRIERMEGEIRDLQCVVRGSHEHQARERTRLQDRIDWLEKEASGHRALIHQWWRRKEAERSELREGYERKHAATVRKLDARDRTVAWLRGRNERLRAGTARATELVSTLRGKNAGLRARIRERDARYDELAARAERLERENDRLRSTRAVLSRSQFGTSSERQEKPGSGRNRGQQPGAAGHGRTPRPTLEERIEEYHPPDGTCLCGHCGRPYVANGMRETTLVEVEVKAHRRVIRRSRWRRACTCESAPVEVTAPPVERLFPGTSYGISVWARFLFECFACLRPIKRVAAWMGHQGLAVSAGTLADSIPRFLTLMEPVSAAILAHQNEAAVRHGDETAWRVRALRETGRSGRAWLWGSVTGDSAWFLIDPSRSAAIAMKLFGGTVCVLFLVCDRFSAYKSLARELGGRVVLCWCWSHQRRSFIDGAAGHPRLARWCERWTDRIAAIYRLNKARLAHFEPHPGPQTAAYFAAQRELAEAVDGLFRDAEEELAGLSDKALKAKPLRSLLNHREGLGVFVDRPEVPMDNNAAERVLREPVIGRRLSLGSDSETGARFTAVMYSVVVTLKMNGIDILKWLESWLRACAGNGGRPPGDLSPWLPWKMSAERRRELAASG